MKEIQITYFLLLLFIFSCNPPNTVNEVKNADTCEINIDSIKDIKNSMVDLDTNTKPTFYFIEFTNFLDSLGFIADTNRAKIVSYRVLEKNNIHIFSNSPFYKLSKKNPDIIAAKDWFETQPYKDSSVNYKILECVENAFGYYYRHNTKSDWVEDGVIEEWQFSTENEAKEAMKHLNKIKHIVYFNTRSFTLLKKNQLYVFHTRASAFDNTLKNHFDNASEFIVNHH